MDNSQILACGGHFSWLHVKLQIITYATCQASELYRYIHQYVVLKKVLQKCVAIDSPCIKNKDKTALVLFLLP